MIRLGLLLLFVAATSAEDMFQRDITSMIFTQGAPVETDPTRQQIECTGPCQIPSKISCLNQGWDGTHFVWGCESLSGQAFQPYGFTVQCKRVDGEGVGVRVERNSCSLVVHTSWGLMVGEMLLVVVIVLLILCALRSGDASCLFCLFSMMDSMMDSRKGRSKSFGGSSYV